MFNFFSDQSLVDGFNERIEYLVEERVTKIPMKFQNRKDHIVHEMQKAAPDDYRGLNITGYPDQNTSQVNRLAIHDVTSNEVKNEIAREIFAEIDPDIEEKTAGRNKFVRMATKKAIHFAIRQAISRAVDAVKTRLEQQYNVDSKKNENARSKK